MGNCFSRESDLVPFAGEVLGLSLGGHFLVLLGREHLHLRVEAIGGVGIVRFVGGAKGIGAVGHAPILYLRWAGVKDPMPIYPRRQVPRPLA